MYFTHRALAQTAAHRRLFGPVVEFDRRVHGIVFFAADLDTRNIMADPMLRDYARQFFETVAVEADRTDPDRVSDLIKALLPDRTVLGRAGGQESRGRPPDRAPPAGRLGADVLRDAAREAGAAGRAARGESALVHDRDRRRLGFTETSSFSRWFRAEFGCSPREWRSRENE